MKLLFAQSIYTISERKLKNIFCVWEVFRFNRCHFRSQLVGFWERLIWNLAIKKRKNITNIHRFMSRNLQRILAIRNTSKPKWLFRFHQLQSPIWGKYNIWKRYCCDSSSSTIERHKYSSFSVYLKYIFLSILNRNNYF